MKKNNSRNCTCADCFAIRARKKSEADLHYFIGANAANESGDLKDFEVDLVFSSCIHWDVGFAGNSRYFVYCADDGALTAWYDNVVGIGFKPLSRSH